MITLITLITMGFDGVWIMSPIFYYFLMPSSFHHFPNHTLRLTNTSCCVISLLHYRFVIYSLFYLKDLPKQPESCNLFFLWVLINLTLYQYQYQICTQLICLPWYPKAELSHQTRAKTKLLIVPATEVLYVEHIKRSQSKTVRNTVDFASVSYKITTYYYHYQLVCHKLMLTVR